MTRSVLSLCLLLAILLQPSGAHQSSEGHVKHRGHKKHHGHRHHKKPVHHHEPPPAPRCEVRPDFSSTETELRSAIFKGDIELAAKILTRNEPWALSAGLRYTPEQQCAVVETSDRARDPDIVAIKAVALNVEQTGDAAKMARVTVQSFETPCKCPLRAPSVFDQMEREFRAIFADPEERREILEYEENTATQQHHHYHHHVRRHLLATDQSPTDSLICAHCDPAKQCRPAYWCPR